MSARAVGWPHRILVTGVGGAPGFDLARGLRRAGVEVVTVDADPLAAGLLLPAAASRVVVPAEHPHYRSRLLEVCRELRPDAILPTVERELPYLCALQDVLAEVGVACWLPEPDAVTACLDKAVFHTVMREHGVPTPRTFRPDQMDAAPAVPGWVVKPRRGQGGQGVCFCATPAQARVLCELVDAPVVQERVTGREFTADCLVDRDGTMSVILRYRLLVKGGLSMVGVTFHNRQVTAAVSATLAAVGAVGLCCAQGFLVDGEDGPAVVMTEVNARVAGGFPLAEAAGADLIGQTLNGLAGRPVDHGALRYRSGVYLTKYVETLAAGPAASAGFPSGAQPAGPKAHR